MNKAKKVKNLYLELKEMMAIDEKELSMGEIIEQIDRIEEIENEIKQIEDDINA